jgi:L-ribulokinase
MKISRSAQTCALGAAIFGAVVGGAYKTTEQAQRRMTGFKPTVYRPDKAAAVYAELYGLYRLLHDALGARSYQGEISSVMKRLIALRDRIRNP